MFLEKTQRVSVWPAVGAAFGFVGDITIATASVDHISPTGSDEVCSVCFRMWPRPGTQRARSLNARQISERGYLAVSSSQLVADVAGLTALQHVPADHRALTGPIRLAPLGVADGHDSHHGAPRDELLRRVAAYRESHGCVHGTAEPATAKEASRASLKLPTAGEMLIFDYLAIAHWPSWLTKRRPGCTEASTAPEKRAPCRAGRAAR